MICIQSEHVAGAYTPVFGSGDLKFPVDVDTADKVRNLLLHSFKKSCNYKMN